MGCDPGVLLLFLTLLAERLLWLAAGIIAGLGLEHLFHIWERLIGWRVGQWKNSGRR